MEVINDLLNYKNLKIVQNTDWFKFSLDSVLLANFVTVKNRKVKVIDLCSGNVPIPLFLSNKIDNKIVGIEIQKEIVDLAKKTIKINNLENKIEILNLDVNTLREKYHSDTFDIITCNPPYFLIHEKSKINDNIIKSIARHELKINLDNIFSISRYLLKNNGNIAIVHRTERFLEIIEKMKQNKLEPKKIQFVYPKKNLNSNIVLIEAKKNGKPGLKLLPPLIIHDNNGKYKKEIERMFI